MKLLEIENDERYHYATANVLINALLARKIKELEGLKDE